MSEPVWLGRRVVEAIHDEQIAEHGGTRGLRDAGLVASALARPINAFADGERDLAALAAAYAFGIARNHPFADGNKRTAFLAAYTFLGLNGRELTAPEAEAVVMTLGLAAGDLPEPGYAAWLRDNT